MKPVSVSTSSQEAWTPLVKAKGYCAGHEMAGRHQFGLDARRQRVGAEIDDPRQFAQFDPDRAVAGVDDLIV